MSFIGGEEGDLAPQKNQNTELGVGSKTAEKTLQGHSNTLIEQSSTCSIS